MSGPAFSVEVDQNPYLPAGGRDVSAIVTVTAPDSLAGAAQPGDGGSAEVIIDVLDAPTGAQAEETG
jgi:hypothetical protein